MRYVQSRDEAREVVRALSDGGPIADIGDGVTVLRTGRPDESSGGPGFTVMLGEHPIATSLNPDEAAAIAFRAAHDPLKTVIHRLQHEQGVNARLREQSAEERQVSAVQASAVYRDVHDRIGIAVLLMLALPFATALLYRVHVALAIAIWLAVPAAFMYAARRYGRG